jgi:Cu/Ag efflux pump CusA
LFTRRRGATASMTTRQYPRLVSEWIGSVGLQQKMMTVVAIMAGLLPIMWSSGAGSEIMQRIAVPMIGGMISSTLLTLIVIPAIYGLIKQASLNTASQELKAVVT